ncbi:hypothetical protein [Verminephrobacter aporrectodeae]|nr:hypothetical protein [Verminephrobacter aporrectodeae]
MVTSVACESILTEPKKLHAIDIDRMDLFAGEIPEFDEVAVAVKFARQRIDQKNRPLVWSLIAQVNVFELFRRPTHQGLRTLLAKSAYCGGKLELYVMAWHAVCNGIKAYNTGVKTND